MKIHLEEEDRAELPETIDEINLEGAEITVPEVAEDKEIKSEPDITFTIEYQCDVCDGLFYSKSDLQDHSKIHKNTSISVKLNQKTRHRAGSLGTEQGLPCDLCGLSLRSKNALKNHMKAEHKLHCDRCDAEFSTPRQLAGHDRVCRDGTGPEMCSLCGKQYKNLACHNLKVRTNRYTRECKHIF